MKFIKLSILLSMVIGLGFVVSADVISDRTTEKSAGVFVNISPSMFNYEPVDCLNCTSKINHLFRDTVGKVDSTVLINEAFDSAVETMLDEMGTVSHGIDKEVSPCEDHFQFVNGGWRKSVTLPKSSARGHQMMSFFTYADVKLLKHLQALFDSARSVHSSTSNATIKVLGTFYESCMAVDTLEYAALKMARLKKNKTDSTRSQECVSRTMQYLGGAAGQAFAEDLKRSGAIDRMNALTASLKETVIEQLKENTIMNEEERKNALDRLGNLVFRVGIPEHLVDYSVLSLSPNDYWGNKQIVASFGYSRQINGIGGNLRDKWKMSLLRSNASYLAGDHAIEVSALLFYPPFFFRDGEDLLNYAGVGYIIGHEIFHSIAPQLATIESSKMKDEIDSFKAFTTSIGEFDGWKTNGNRTFSEDVADLGGSRAAYRAWKKTVKKDKKYSDRKIDGFTPDQRFFIVMGRVWRSKWTANGIGHGVHGPLFARVNGVVMQSPEFRQVFGCKPGDRMYLSDEELSKIW